jgi:hypothetical protein
MPRGISEELLAKCQGQYNSLEKAIEGLKTEIQWVSKFQHACEGKGITISNRDNLIQHYQQQIEILEAVCQNKSQRLGGTLTSTSTLSTMSSFKARFQNTVHESLNHGAENELAKAKKTLEEIRSFSAASSMQHPEHIDVAQSYRDRIAAMHAGLPAPQQQDEPLGPEEHFEL